MDQHVKTVVRSCFFHLLRLKSVRRILGREVTLGQVSAFVVTRLDYCNSVLAGLPQATIDPLQRVQNASCQTCRWNRDTGSHHSCTQKPALASDQVTHTVQTVCAYAPSAHRSQSCLPGRHNDSHCRSTRS